MPSYTSAVAKEDFKAAAIFEEMEKTLKKVRWRLRRTYELVVVVFLYLSQAGYNF